MAQNKKMLITISIIALLLTFPTIYAVDIVKKKYFDGIDDKVILAKVDGVTVSLEEYLFYQENVEMNKKIPTGEINTPVLSDTEVIKDLLRNKIAANEARKLGFQPDQDSIEQSIQTEIEWMNLTKDPKYDLSRKLLNDRLDNAGITLEEFLYSDMIMEIFENDDLGSQWANYLISKGEIDDHAAFHPYLDRLLDEKMESVTIYWARFPE